MCGLVPRTAFASVSKTGDADGEGHESAEGKGHQAATEAPELLFERWEEDMKSSCTLPSFRWLEGFDAPEATLRKLEHLQPRTVPSFAQQAFFMTKRSFATHEHSTFVLILIGLYVTGFLFSLLVVISSPSEVGFYIYGRLPQYLSGNVAGSSLYFLLTAAAARPVFGASALKLCMHREYLVGVNSMSFWLARNLYFLALLPLIAGAYNIAAYLEAPPVQWFGTHYLAHVMAAWFWSGAAMMVAQATSSELAQSIILIFWPLSEPIIDGTLLGSGASSMHSTAWLSCSRWYLQILLAAELRELPPQILTIPDVRSALQTQLMETSKEGLERNVIGGAQTLFGFGLVFRLLCALMLAHEQYGTAPLRLLLSSFRHRLHLNTGLVSHPEAEGVLADADAAFNSRDVLQAQVEAAMSRTPRPKLKRDERHTFALSSFALSDSSRRSLCAPRASSLSRNAGSYPSLSDAVVGGQPSSAFGQQRRATASLSQEERGRHATASLSQESSRPTRLSHPVPANL